MLGVVLAAYAFQKRVLRPVRALDSGVQRLSASQLDVVLPVLTRMRVAPALLPEDENKTSIAADLDEMEAMITELLELERLRDGRGIRRERNDLVSILREVAKNYEQRQPGIRFAVPSEIILELDRERFAQCSGTSWKMQRSIVFRTVVLWRFPR
jgi:signal transduction histidine kinase